MRIRVAVGVALLGPATRAGAQPPPAAPPPLAVTASAALAQPRSGRDPIALTLSRPLARADGALVVLAGDLDVTALTTVSGTRVQVVPGAFPIPSGSVELSVLLEREGRYRTVARFPLRVRYPGGFTVADVTPTVDVNSSGLALRGGSAADQPPRTQQVGGTITYRSRHERGAFSIETQSNILGVAQVERALRFGERGRRAPLLDLASYSIAMRIPGMQVDVGHVSMGASRHLASGVSARGILLRTGPSWARLAVGSVAGTSLVGWDNLLGVTDAPHRINSASLTLDVLRRRPGALALRVEALDGARAPRAGFTQGAIVDAEASRGASLEVTATTPGQRGRLTAGYTTSAFQNPMRDPALTEGLPVATLARDRRSARFAEASVSLLQGRQLRRGLPVSLGMTVRHERIDPLFRSVGAFSQADRAQDGVDLTGTLGVVTWQGGLSRGRDNLADVTSILTSRTRGSTANASVALAQLLRVRTRQVLLPRLTVTWMGTHQFAVAAPASNDFRPQDLADQMATQRTFALQWSGTRWTAMYRDGFARQDNRQPTRELADFTNRSQALSLGRALGRRFDASLEGSVEVQENLERREGARTRRVGVASSWRPDASTTLGTNVTLARARTPPATRDNTNVEARAELARRVRLYGRGASARTGQAFVRYARTLQRVAPVGAFAAPDLRTTLQWSINTGLALRLR